MIMEYRQIVAVTGLSGLYQLVNTKNDGAIIRSLSDKSIKFVSARIHHITPLEGIEIYTTDENVRLHEVLQSIQKNDAEVAQLAHKKDDKAAKAYFRTILPNYDDERVYNSDIRKVLKWYEILKANDLLHFEHLNTPATDEETAEVAVTETEATVAEKPAKKAKKTTTQPEDTTPPETAEKKATKKAAPKKKTAIAEDGTEKPAKKTATKKKKEAE